MKIIIWVSIESKPENQSSNQFTELKYFENWASYGQMSFFFSLNEFHERTQKPNSVKFQYYQICKFI